MIAFIKKWLGLPVKLDLAILYWYLKLIFCVSYCSGIGNYVADV